MKLANRLIIISVCVGILFANIFHVELVRAEEEEENEGADHPHDHDHPDHEESSALKNGTELSASGNNTDPGNSRLGLESIMGAMGGGGAQMLLGGAAEMLKGPAQMIAGAVKDTVSNAAQTAIGTVSNAVNQHVSETVGRLTQGAIDLVTGRGRRAQARGGEAEQGGQGGPEGQGGQQVDPRMIAQIQAQAKAEAQKEMEAQMQAYQQHMEAKSAAEKQAQVQAQMQAQLEAQGRILAQQQALLAQRGIVSPSIDPVMAAPAPVGGMAQAPAAVQSKPTGTNPAQTQTVTSPRNPAPTTTHAPTTSSLTTRKPSASKWEESYKKILESHNRQPVEKPTRSRSGIAHPDHPDNMNSEEVTKPKEDEGESRAETDEGNRDDVNDDDESQGKRRRKRHYSSKILLGSPYEIKNQAAFPVSSSIKSHIKTPTSIHVNRR